MRTDSREETGATEVKATNLTSAIPRLSLIVATLIVSLAFLNVAAPFVIAIVLAGIATELSRPLYDWFCRLTGGRENAASGLTLASGMFMVIIPLIGITALAATQAASVLEDSGELVETLTEDVQAFRAGTLKLPEWVPYAQDIEAAGPQIYDKARELITKGASFLISSLSEITNGTASFFLSLFAFLYAMFFFLTDSQSVFSRVLSYSGLPVALQAKLDNRIISVSRATIKGSLMIGVIQGALGGFAFWVAGFEGAVFWAVVMAILAAIPGLGATPVVFIGAIYLGFQGETLSAVLMAAWAGLVVGTIDNVLRPRLVGKDAQMSDLWIFISTLGGLATFGASGLVLGPVLAGLFITVWEEVATLARGEPSAPAPEVKAEPVAAPAPTEEKTTEESGFKLTATREEMEAEVAQLKKELTKKRQD